MADAWPRPACYDEPHWEWFVPAPQHGGNRSVSQETHKSVARDEPVCYEIQVQGRLSQAWVAYLGSVAVSVAGDGDHAVTTLSGRAMDQAALMGLLNSLYDLGHPLLSVEYLSESGPEVAHG